MRIKASVSSVLLGIYGVIGKIVSRLLSTNFHRAKVVAAATSRKIKTH